MSGSSAPNVRAVRRTIVVGAGIAGLMTTWRLCAAGVPVLLLSRLPARRAASVTMHSGIAAALNPFGTDGAHLHAMDTLRAGGGLANPAAVRALVDAAPELVHLLDRCGVPFHRTPEGQLELRYAPGCSQRRVAFAGASTGRHVLNALEEQVRRIGGEPARDERGLTIGGEPLVRRLEHWDLVALVRDDNGVVVGIAAQDLRTMRVRAFPGDGVCLATGGMGALFERSTAPLSATGSAAAIAFRAGAVLANLEHLSFEATAYAAGARQRRSLGEGLRSEGARLWVPKDRRDARKGRDIPEAERDYFLERRLADTRPALADGGALPPLGLVTEDVVARAIHALCDRDGHGCYDAATRKNEDVVYLDATHLDRPRLSSRVGEALERYATFTGENPHTDPMRVTPAVRGVAGGLWVDLETNAYGALVSGSPRQHATSLPGLYAAGECEYQYHGRHPLGGNELLATLFAGSLAASALTAYRRALSRSATALPPSLFERAESAARTEYETLLARGNDSSTNHYVLADELAAGLWSACTFDRDRSTLDRFLAGLPELQRRAARAELADRGAAANRAVVQARDLDHGLLLATVIATGARRALEPAAGTGRRNTLVTYDGGEVRCVNSFTTSCVGREVTIEDDHDTRASATARWPETGGEG